MRSLSIYKSSVDTILPLAYADQGVRAGFPSPAQDFMELSIDFNRDMIKNPLSTFYARVKGSSMIDDGIDDGDEVLGTVAGLDLPAMGTNPLRKNILIIF